jgi:enoyl-[acyl-carrier protein] reductase II
MVSQNRVMVHTGARYPIIQAPMTYIATAPLASAVSSAGGIGIIATSVGVAYAADMLEKTRAATDAPFGANVLVSGVKDDSLIDVICDAGVRFVTTSAGSPTRFIERLKDRGVTVYHVVPTVAAAMKALAAGVDGLVVEGAEGGGFKSPDDVSSLVLLQAVRRVVDLPLVAAGGIVDGYGMAAAFALGAEGVQMGTRFLVSRESPIHPDYKAALVAARETDTVMLNRQSKPAIRALKTPVALKIMADGGLVPPEAFVRITELYYGGDLEASVACAGQGVGLIGSEDSVADIVEQTIKEFFDVVNGMADRYSSHTF